MKSYLYETNCVNANGNDIQEMCDSAREVTFKTINKHCDLKPFQHPTIPLQKDYAVSFWKSKYRGKQCYYLVHSCIEYIFVKVV